MTEVARIARFQVDPARRDELFAAYSIYEEAVKGEGATLVWEMCTEVDDENQVWLFVRAADAASLEAHRSSEAVAQLGSVLMPALVGDPEFHDLIPRFNRGPSSDRQGQ